MNKKITSSLSLLLIAMAILTMSFDIKPKPTIYIIGDSTAAEKQIKNGSTERGWGMVLRGFLDEGVEVSNHAVNGRSSRSFYTEGRWQKVVDRLKPGDYVVIQFGHNDEKTPPERHTDVGTTFDAHLAQYVRETQQRGATAILMNPVARRNFYLQPTDEADDEALRTKGPTADKVNSDTLIDTHGDYRYVAEKVAAQYGAVFVDANRLTTDLENRLGPDASRGIHMWLEPGKYDFAPNGRSDNTHYNVEGAHLVAGILIDAIGEKIPELREHIRHYDYIVSSEGRGNYLTPEAALEAIPRSKKAVKVLVLDSDIELPRAPKGKKVEWVVMRR